MRARPSGFRASNENPLAGEGVLEGLETASGTDWLGG